MTETANGRADLATGGLAFDRQELIMQNSKTLMRVGVVGALLVVLCCVTPILVILLGVIGLSALTGHLDYVLLPALAMFIGLTIYAVRRKQQVDACCASNHSGVKK